MRSSLFAVAAVAALLLSGCTSPEAESQPGKSGLVRHIVADINQDRVHMAERAGSIEAAMASFATVWYEYTHTGDPVAPADLTFQYTLVSGTPGSAPLSKFTTRPTLRDGDLVKIQPSPAAGVFGPVKVVNTAGEVLSARSGAVENWFTVANHPIPLAASEAGTTTWEMDAEGSLKAEVRDMELPDSSRYECDDYDCREVSEPSGHINHARIDLGVDIEGKLSVEASPEAVNFDMSAGLDYDVDVLFDATTPDADIDGTVVGTASLDATATFDMAFNAKREIKSVAYANHFVLDGDVDVEGFPGAEPPQQHPWMEQTEPRKTYPLALGTQAPDKTLVQFLTAAYALDIAEGDEIRLEATGPVDDLGKSVSMRYVSQVLGVEDRTVGGQDRPAFKVADTFSLRMLEGATVAKEHKVELTYWVDLATNLPVYAQSKIQQTFDGASLENALSFLRGMEGVELPVIPEGATMVFTTEATQRMTAYGGDFATAAIVGVGAARLVPLLGAVSLMGSNY
ncbi:MAG: hypothetical protein QOD77_1353 [Thermoplasmata archaeon]|jgi:hypothetical protein|nr:hypothetical protein [Thermoplasmata archaeon]